MASLLLAEDKLEEICAMLDGRGGAAPGRITQESSDHWPPPHIEPPPGSRPRGQAVLSGRAQAATLFKQAVHMSSSMTQGRRRRDGARPGRRRRAAGGGQCLIQSEGHRRSARSWSKAAAMLKAAGKPDAKLLEHRRRHLAGDKFAGAPRR